MKKNCILLIGVLFILLSCKQKKAIKSKDNTDNIIEMNNCQNDIYLDNLKINLIACGKEVEKYTFDKIEQKINLEIYKKESKVADENTGGQNTYWNLEFKDQTGKLSIQIWDKNLPEFYLTNHNVSLKIGKKKIKVGDSTEKLKRIIKNYNYTEKKNELYFLIDYSSISFGIKKGKISSIGLTGNYFY